MKIQAIHPPAFFTPAQIRQWEVLLAGQIPQDLPPAFYRNLAENLLRCNGARLVRSCRAGDPCPTAAETIRWSVPMALLAGFTESQGKELQRHLQVELHRGRAHAL